MNDPYQLAEMLCTRLCHDITGPIGAVNNGAEFLEEEEFSMNEDALKLITDSAKEAVHRLQFFRQAYGRVKEMGDASLGDKKLLAENFLRQTRITLDWPDTHTDASDVSLNQGLAKLLLNLIIPVTGSLIRGGTLSIRLEKDGADGKRIRVRGEGEGVRLDEQVVAALTQPVSEEQLSSKNVQAYFTQLLAARMGATLQIEHTPQSFEVIAVK